MNCRRMQELLKTGYLDGRLSPLQEQDIQRHLSDCPRCRALEKELQAQRLFFKKIGQQEVPARVWHNIRHAIVNQELEKDAVINKGVLQWLKEVIFARRPAFALASAFALVIFVMAFTGIAIHRHQLLIELNNEEIISDYSLTNSALDTGYDLGTNIEQYFL